MNRYLAVKEEIRRALDAGKPVLTFESTIISQGMPYPRNLETALEAEALAGKGGAVPATVSAGARAILDLSVDSAVQIARIYRAQEALGLKQGLPGAEIAGLLD